MELMESPTQSSLLNTFFRLSGFQSSVLLRIADHTAPKYGKKPIRYVTLHFLDWRVAASRRHNRSCVWTIWHKDTKYSISGFI